MSNNFDYDLDELEDELMAMDDDDLDYEVGASLARRPSSLDAVLGLSRPGRVKASARPLRAMRRNRVRARPSVALRADDGGDDVNLNVETMRAMLAAIVEEQKALKAMQKQLAQQMKLQKLSAASTAGEVPQALLGIDSLDKAQNGIAPGTSLTISVEATDPLRITSLLVDDVIAGDFSISRIQIGRMNLLAGAYPVPASIFKSGIERPPIATPILPAGTEASIEVQNRSGAPRDFKAAFMGIDTNRR